jgi:signal transduction histidine kinase
MRSRVALSVVLLSLLPLLGTAQFAPEALLDSAKALGLEDAKAKEILFRGALKALDERGSAELKAEANEEFGKFFFYTSRYDSALVYFQRCTPLLENSSLDLANCYNNQAAAYQRLGRLKEATDRYIEAQRIFEYLDDQAGLAKVFNNLSVLNQSSGELAKAIFYIRMSLGMNRALADSIRIGGNLNNLGTIFLRQNLLDSARHCFEMSLEWKGSGAQWGGSTLNNLGLIHARKGENGIAEDYLKRALEYRRQNNDLRGVVSTLLNLTELYSTMRRDTEAYSFLEELKKMEVPSNDYEMLQRIAKAEGAVSALLGDAEGTQTFFNLALAYSDSVYEAKRSKQILEMNRRYELEKSAAEIDRLKREKEFVESEFRRDQLILLVLLVSVALLFASLIANRQRARQNARLSEKYQAQKQIAEQNAIFKEQSMNILSHEVRTPINGIINLTEFLKTQCPNDELHEMVEMIETSAVRLNNVVMNVLNVAKYQAGLLEMDLLPTDVVEVCQQAVASFAHSAKLELLHLDYEGSEQPVHCLLDAQLLHSILNNLIGNSLKFTPSGGHIVVSVEQKSDRGIIRVRDTGSGMTQDQVKAIFKPFQQVSEEKEKRRVGTGLGLSIVSQFTELMSGTVDVESQKGEGTTFTLSFPLQA